jgi:AcrR family transcriptional regulator
MSGQETREKLVEAATNLFYENGYDATSIRDIGEAIGLSSSNIYYYFKNKEEILYEILVTTSEELYQELSKIEKDGLNPIEKYRKLIRVHINLILRRLHKGSKIWTRDYNRLGNEHFDRFRRKNKRIYEIYKNIINRVNAMGILSDIDPTVIIYGIMGMTNMFAQSFNEYGRLTSEDLSKEIEKFIFKAVFK